PSTVCPPPPPPPLSLHDALPISFRTRPGPSTPATPPLPRPPDQAVLPSSRNPSSTYFLRYTSGTFSASPSISSARSTSFSNSTRDRKSTRLNSSHDQISYAVFCL